MFRQYQTPKNFGIPNPLGPRLHNWRGGRLNEGSLFHGPVYTRPSYNLPRIPRPLFGLGQTGEPSMLAVVGTGAVLFGLTYLAAELLFPVPPRR